MLQIFCNLQLDVGQGAFDLVSFSSSELSTLDSNNINTPATPTTSNPSGADVFT